MTDAREVIGIYMFLRLLISSYLLLLGFEQFDYYWKQKQSELPESNAGTDFKGLVRFLKVSNKKYR